MVAEYFPAPHDAQTSLPELAADVPAGQDVHDDEPVAAAKWPALQVVHVLPW